MPLRSLRGRLLAAAAIATVAAVGLVFAVSLPLLEASLRAQGEQRRSTTGQLLQAALAGPLAERDYATLERILAETLRDGAIDYAVVRSARGQTVAAAGSRGASATLDAEVVVSMGGQTLAVVSYGISATFLAEARTRLLQRAATAGLLAGALALALMLLAAHRITRPLARLTRVAGEIGRGNFDAELPAGGSEEIGALSAALRAMSEALKARIRALGESEGLQRRYLAQARDEHARLAALLGAMRIGVAFVGTDDRVLYVNPAFRSIWLLPPDYDAVGGSLQQALEATVYDRAYLAPLLYRMERLARGEADNAAGDVSSTGPECVLPDGRIVVQFTSLVRPPSDAEPIGRLWLYEDVTAARRATQLAYLAERDALTGLYNRRGFQRELEQTISQAKRRGDKVALLFVDLDEFKYVNDTFGHKRGDELLISVVSRLQAQLREHEVLARLGGDEFAILAGGADAEEFRSLAERVVACVRGARDGSPGGAPRVSCSVGVAVYPDHADSADKLVINADLAMYAAKEAGKNCWRMYASPTGSIGEGLQRAVWRERLGAAIESDALQLAIQGVYETQRGTLSYYELLARLPDPEGSGRLLEAAQFIPVAEKTGQILEIDRQVLRRAVALLGAHPRIAGLAVNVSGRSLDDAALPEFIAGELRARSVAPSRLHIELTETLAVSDLQQARRFIEAMRTTGCRICLDDFGSGFSSLAYLKLLQVDIIKIDRLFVRNLGGDADDQLLVRAIIDIGRGLKKTVVAEGVEDAKSFEHLRAWGAHHVQGYYFDRPRLIPWRVSPGSDCESVIAGAGS